MLRPSVRVAHWLACLSAGLLGSAILQSASELLGAGTGAVLPTLAIMLAFFALTRPLKPPPRWAKPLTVLPCIALHFSGDLMLGLTYATHAVLNATSEAPTLMVCILIASCWPATRILSTAIQPSKRSAGAAFFAAGILLASSSDAVVLGFNVKVESNAVKTAKREGVQIKLYSIVYELIDQVKDAMLGMLEPELREKILGHAEVKQVFKVKRGRAAGCLVADGKVTRTAHARVLRQGTPVFDGKMSTLRRIQDDVEEVKQGIECGIRLGEFNEYEVGDVIECYELEKIEQTL